MGNYIFPVITENEMKFPYYIIGVGCFHTQEHVIRPDGFPHYQWIQCYRGEGELLMDGVTYRVGEKQGMLLFPDIPHEYYALSDSWEVDWVILGGLHLDDFFKHTAGIGKPGVYHVTKPDILLSRIWEVLAIEQSDSPVKSLECSRLAYDILLNVLQNTSLKSDSSMDQRYEKLKPLFHYIEKYYSRPLSLDQLSRTVGVTPQHLCVLFKRVTGVRIFEYINFVRIKKAKETILLHRDKPIKEIARLSGYDDVSYFCSQFKKVEHISPNAFKKLHMFGE